MSPIENDGTDLEREEAIAARDKIARFYARKRARESVQVSDLPETGDSQIENPAET